MVIFNTNENQILTFVLYSELLCTGETAKAAVQSGEQTFTSLTLLFIDNENSV